MLRNTMMLLGVAAFAAYTPGAGAEACDADHDYYDDGCVRLRRVHTTRGWKLRRIRVC
jgi:hypothetical protein